VRALRDRTDLFEGGGNVIRLGRHRFSVNTQPLDLTILPRGDGLAVHLTGTDYYETIVDPELEALRAYWPVTLDSESPSLYRGEYLAGLLLDAAINNRDGLSVELLLREAAQPEALAKRVRDFAAPRYREGYEKGIHDHDASLILQALLPLYQAAGSLVHAAAPRALALLFWGRESKHENVSQWVERAAGAFAIAQLFNVRDGLEALRDEIALALAEFQQAHALPFDSGVPALAAEYLLAELANGEPTFAFSGYARQLLNGLREQLQAAGQADAFDRSLQRLSKRLALQWAQAVQWLQAMCGQDKYAAMAGYVPEAAAMLLGERALRSQVREVTLIADIGGLLGEHARIRQGHLQLAVDDFLQRWQSHRGQFQPGFEQYQALRQRISAREREALRLNEFQARPLSSFVRNKLINDVYLPIIGDNLAKQMGTVGENKRSDLMGLLMMISPPGYGKTTLMEYVANRLGLVFMKINGPALGHEVRSLDPEQAPDATSRQELHKLNLALEMGNNTMLYVDDIQHTHPEFLQKFISLCDGTRRIEGVWKGRTKTYDLRGKKFCVVMAGNPYTESGEVFKVPDMLANRADIYNLGDVLGGMEEAFKLSYIENSLTSSQVLAPMATRDLDDLYLLVDKANGKEVSTNALSHAYSGAEINEIVATLQRLMQVREVVYRVNQQYIASAAQADKYRVEPPFRLQGSYRNMNKLSEKISPVMNAAELQQLISDHYLGESQLLTSGSEENLLKLGELRGVLDAQQLARWEQIKHDFMRDKAMGGDDADTGARVVAQLADIASGLQGLRSEEPTQGATTAPAPEAPWAQIVSLLQAVAERPAAVLQAPAAEASAPPPAAPVQDLAPLLQALVAAQQRQGQVGDALSALAAQLQEWLSKEGTTAKAVPRARRARTPEEKALDEALMRHFYGGSIVVPGQQGSRGKDAPDDA